MERNNPNLRTNNTIITVNNVPENRSLNVKWYQLKHKLIFHELSLAPGFEKKKKKVFFWWIKLEILFIFFFSIVSDYVSDFFKKVYK